MRFPVRAGLIPVPGVVAEFAAPSGHAAGNDVPAVTGTVPRPVGPGPGPGSGGQAGAGRGADPARPRVSPAPRVVKPAPEGGTSPGLVRRFFSTGIVGFNDQRRVVDRHAYWDAGSKRTGTSPGQPGNPPNPLLDGPARPDLRLTQRTVTPQIGSDASRNQDDLSRAYTWVGEQGSGWSPVYGGVPGLYQPYGTRGGVPYPIVSPVDLGATGDGRKLVFSGPPHGLHSQTLPDTAQTLSRYYVAPQQRPVRVDRPSNSPQAGQSYSQTVQMQGGPGQVGTYRAGMPGSRTGGRGWSGEQQAGRLS